MHIAIDHRCDDFQSYRAARVKSLFNVETGANFSLVVDLPIDDGDWTLGVIVGPSGSGKTSMGRQVFGPGAMYEPHGWPTDEPIVDAIAPAGDFNAVTGALAAVGLGTVPSWLRPYHVLSNGERFRADLARIISDAPAQIVVDEFTSVVDRQIAKIGALAFQKAWRRTRGQCVLLSCHYDILDWLEPDWVFDTRTHTCARGSLWRRPRIQLEILQTDWRYWPLFEPHHYLKLPKMIGAKCYVGTVEGELVAHLGVSSMSNPTMPPGYEARACRMVVMPEWQGAGVGTRFLNAICDLYLRGEGHLKAPTCTIFHTSHPGLVAALRRDPKWRQVSAVMHGVNKKQSTRHATHSAARRKREGTGKGTLASVGYGGHTRAVQGFRFWGEYGVQQRQAKQAVSPAA